MEKKNYLNDFRETHHMKYILVLISIVALTLTACGSAQQEQTPATPPAPTDVEMED